MFSRSPLNNFSVQKFSQTNFSNVSEKSFINKTIKHNNSKSNSKLFNPSDYTGTWSGWDSAVNNNGLVQTLKTITLVCEDSGKLSGTVNWKAFDNPGGFDSSGNPVKENTENVIGIVEKVTGHISLVETLELGTLNGFLEGNYIRLRQTQPGDKPVVSIMLLEKVSN